MWRWDSGLAICEPSATNDAARVLCAGPSWGNVEFRDLASMPRCFLEPGFPTSTLSLQGAMPRGAVYGGMAMINHELIELHYQITRWANVAKQAEKALRDQPEGYDAAAAERDRQVIRAAAHSIASLKETFYELAGSPYQESAFAHRPFTSRRAPAPIEAEFYGSRQPA